MSRRIPIALSTLFLCACGGDKDSAGAAADTEPAPLAASYVFDSEDLFPEGIA